ncbi:MAG: S8 family serine peptidase [Nitrosopumilus sp.]|nr:S8 family serine peptidase [Nitrosopumilus sp.]MDA7955535.1 S8 family serine peptidase [Nitrosopumilus sp.]MDA7974479.1 S8 family serine peptidase [Nitrosopumilus sp.]MDA7997696.1 S8 family serine peptidase [Nitrosopumilus sp.]
MNTADATYEQKFREYLKEADMSVIRSARAPSGEDGYVWTVLAADPKFKKMRENLGNRPGDKPNSIDWITSITPIDPESKVGPRLKSRPLVGSARIVVFMEAEQAGDPETVDPAESFIADLVRRGGYDIYDRVRTRNLYEILVGCNSRILEAIKMHHKVFRVDRVSEFGLPKRRPGVIGRHPVPGRPRLTGVGILVLDSGVLRHPWLDEVLSRRNMGLPDRRERDDMWHGTSVAGCALYGGLDERRPDDPLVPMFDIYSGKVFYQVQERAKLDRSRMHLSLVAECVRNAAAIPGCRVVNVSFGENPDDMRDWSTQPEFSTLLDDLAEEFSDIVFTVSTGNVKRNQEPPFPDYLRDTGANHARLVPPASSIHALSVGAVQIIRREVVPSDITRIGPGLDDMIKPDLVELGGGYQNPVHVLNPDYTERPITLDAGTSFSAPIVANHVARIMATFPKATRNMIIALLLSSCGYPVTRPEFSGLVPKESPVTQDAGCMRRFHTYGYGKPKIRDALNSNDDRVVLKYEGTIAKNTSEYFEIPIPENFVNEPGKRTVTVSLSFDPPVDKGRADYFSTRLGFHMYRNRWPDEVRDRLSKDVMMDASSEAAKNIDRDEIKFNPGVEKRSKSPHQKGYRILTDKYHMRKDRPLVLVVKRTDKWKDEKHAAQRYAVCVTLEHNRSIGLYQGIMRMNRVSQRAHARV